MLPLALEPFRLNLVGKYLTYGFVALGLVLCWGDAGILSLGQGVFFGLGGYCMAMYLKLEASTPEATKIQSTPGIPDFMDWNQITELPLFWRPFHSLALTLVAIPLVPALLALVVGFAMFKRRVGGTYFAIITQAIAAILTILIIGQQGYTGGVNGITDLRTLNGWDIRTDHARYVLYFINGGLLIGCLLLGQYVRRSKLGRILVAMRDKEDRVRFSGYAVADFKIFVFCFAAALAGIGGAMFTLQVGFMSPSFVGIVPSIEMVIYCAVGGRTSLAGRGLWRAGGELGAHHAVRGVPGAVAARPRLPVHPRRRRLPGRLGRRVPQDVRPDARPAAAVAPPPPVRAWPGRAARRTHRLRGRVGGPRDGVQHRPPARRRGADRLLRRVPRGGRPVVLPWTAARSASSSGRTARARPPCWT